MVLQARIEETAMLLAYYKTELNFLKVSMANWLCEFYINNIRDIPSRAPLIIHKSSNVVMTLPPRPFLLHEKVPHF